MRRLRAALLGCALATAAAAGAPVSGRPSRVDGRHYLQVAGIPSGSPRPVRLLIEAPPALAPEAAHLASLGPAAFGGVMRLLGLEDAGPPIRVFLAAEGSPRARAVPAWVSGYASGAGGWVVLLPARSRTYPNSSLEDVLRHEVAHVLAWRAAGGRPLPHWFDEGLAMLAGGDWRIEDRTRLAFASLSRDKEGLAGIDRRFAGSAAEAESAYALSIGFVYDLIERHGSATPANILRGLAAGRSFEAAFSAATGVSLAQAEAAFWAAQSGWRWLPLVTSPAAAWTGVTLLALLAIALRRRRDAARRALWEATESAEEEEASR